MLIPPFKFKTALPGQNIFPLLSEENIRAAQKSRQDDQELYTRIVPLKLEEMNQYLSEYCDWRNSQRRFKKLEWKTPDEWLEEYNIKALASLIHVGILNFFDPIVQEAS